MKLEALACILAIACGGSVTSNDDAGQDASTKDAPITTDVVVVDTSTDVLVATTYDGTTGKTCASDADCQSANGPNLARCSSSVFAPQDYYPTPVCIVPSCAPISDAQALHFCDGPDDSSSPGICVPDGASGGICLPKCTYDQNGSATVGCKGHDTCWAYVTSKENGVGYCWAGCTQDADCQSGQKCQVDQGLCVKGVSPPTKTFGASCAKSDTSAGVCNCLYGNANTGYCSKFCVVGNAATCPGGALCDSLEYRGYGYTTPNVGMAGYCTIDCTSDAGVCPSVSVCTNVFASGPDCIPP